MGTKAHGKRFSQMRKVELLVHVKNIDETYHAICLAARKSAILICFDDMSDSILKTVSYLQEIVGVHDWTGRFKVIYGRQPGIVVFSPPILLFEYTHGTGVLLSTCTLCGNGFFTTLRMYPNCMIKAVLCHVVRNDSDLVSFMDRHDWSDVPGVLQDDPATGNYFWRVVNTSLAN